MRNKHFARKKRQLKNLSEQLEQQIQLGEEKNENLFAFLIAKIKHLLKALSKVVSATELKKALGAAALIFGLSIGNAANAQDFAEPVQNPFGLNPAETYLTFPAIADIDGDGDLDLMCGEYYGSFSFYENTGTPEAAQFAAAQVNPFGLTSVFEYAFPQFGDLDNDGDFDLMVGEYGGALQYFENTGNALSPAFIEPVVNPFGLDSLLGDVGIIEFADIDDDGDLDIFTYGYAGIIGYIENIGTSELPEFDELQYNPFGLGPGHFYYMAFPAIADIDNDGDLDILFGEYYGNMSFSENTGDSENPEFAESVELPFGLVSTYEVAFPEFADMDNDGDIDLLVAEYYGTLQYFENVSTVGKPECLTKEFNVFPNPTSDLLTIELSDDIVQIELYGLDGMLIKTVENTNQINLKDLSAGSYFVHIKTQNATKIEKIIKQ
jgi:hypothetical protein